MEKKSNAEEAKLRVVFVVGLALVVFVWVVGIIASKPTQPTAEVQIVEVEKPTNIDTSAIDAWCGNYSEGKLRMVGAWMYDTTAEGAVVLEDETGNLWTVTDTPINETDFLLLWIADNHTADNVEDDIIIKVWTEAHN